MSLLRRLSAGRFDGEGVYARLRATESAGDEPMWQQLMASTVGRAGAWLIDITKSAAAESAAVRVVRVASQAWEAMPAVLRLRETGVMTLAAVVTNVAMTALSPTPGAWRWLLPALAAAFGFVLVGLSYCGPRRTEDRN